VLVDGRDGALTYLLPALTAFAAVPLLRAWLGTRVAYTVVAGLALAWGLLANIARPAIYDTSSTATYIVLGCLLDSLAMIILTIPIIFPVVTQLGFDPIWFGVIIVMTVELGLIHPPVGMNVFVIKSVVQEVTFSTIFRGVLPFILTDLIRLVILIAFPILALWLPSHM